MGFPAVSLGFRLTPGPGSANGFSIAISGSWALADPRSGGSPWIFYCNWFFQTNLNCKRRRHLLQLIFVLFFPSKSQLQEVAPDFRFQIPDGRFQNSDIILDSRFRISDCRCQITDFKFQTSHFRLQIAGQEEPGSRSWPGRRRGTRPGNPQSLP